MQAVAPAKAPVLVIQPAEQVAHLGTVDRFEYLPGVHMVQLFAPSAAPVSVIEPAEQGLQ